MDQIESKKSNEKILFTNVILLWSVRNLMVCIYFVVFYVISFYFTAQYFIVLSFTSVYFTSLHFMTSLRTFLLHFVLFRYFQILKTISLSLNTSKCNRKRYRPQFKPCLRKCNQWHNNWNTIAKDKFPGRNHFIPCHQLGRIPIRYRWRQAASIIRSKFWLWSSCSWEEIVGDCQQSWQ